MSHPLPIQPLADAVAQFLERVLKIWFDKAPFPYVNAPPIRDQVHWRIRRLANRFAALIARAIAGTLPTPRLRKPPVPPEPVAPDAALAEATHRRPRKPDPLPREHGWLIRMLPALAPYASGLEGMIYHDPQMAELIAAAPQVGRILRPLLWALGGHVPLIARLHPLEDYQHPNPARGPSAETPQQKPSQRWRLIMGGWLRPLPRKPRRRHGPNAIAGQRPPPNGPGAFSLA
jgi:hypothetical protein